jgi:hypothetical protein
LAFDNLLRLEHIKKRRSDFGHLIVAHEVTNVVISIATLRWSRRSLREPATPSARESAGRRGMPLSNHHFSPNGRISSSKVQASRGCW